MLIKRLLAPVALFILFTSQLLPFSYAKAYWDTVTFSTQAVTDIHNTAAVFHGKVIETYTGIDKTALNENVVPWIIFHYGTTAGSYTHQAYAVMGPVQYSANSMWAYFTASVTGLLPCQEYYVQLYMPAEYRKDWYYIKFIIDPAVKFTTTGCHTNPPGSSGLIASGTSSSSLSSSSSSTYASAPVQMASILVQAAQVSAPTVSPGQDVEISATVANNGTTSGDAKITLYINGEAVESKGLAVAAGQTVPVSFQVSKNEPGKYTVQVNSTPAGNFTVDMFSNNDTLIYGIIALLVLGIAVTLSLLLRKRPA